MSLSSIEICSIPYFKCREAASVALWGPHAAEFDVQGLQPVASDVLSCMHRLVHPKIQAAEE